MTNMLEMTKICHLTLSASHQTFFSAAYLVANRKTIEWRTLKQMKSFTVLKELNYSENIRTRQTCNEISPCFSIYNRAT